MAFSVSRGLRSAAGILIYLLFMPALSAQKLEFSSPAFSPNHDGFSDILMIRVRDFARSSEGLENWVLRIRNKTGKLVRVLAADRRSLRERRSFSNFFLPSDTDARPLRIFSSLIWDGRDDEGQIVPDGSYTVHLQIEYRKGSTAFQDIQGEVIVDTDPPAAELSGVRSRIVRKIPASKDPAAEDEISLIQKQTGGFVFTGKIYNASFRLIEERKWTSDLPEKIYWNGKMKSGEGAPYGNYFYTLTVQDAAGNSSEASLYNLSVVPESFPIDLACGNCIFRTEDALTFHVEPGEKISESLKKRTFRKDKFSWELGIFSDSKSVLSENGKGIPDRILLRGKKNFFKDGIYTARVVFRYENEVFESYPRTFIIDDRPPASGISFSSSFLSHDGDGQNETVSIRMEYADTLPPQRWTLELFLNAEGGESGRKIRKKIRVFTGRKPPEEILWNGSADEISLKSFEKVEAVFQTQDLAGNASEKSESVLNIAPLIESSITDGSELKIEIPEQGYFLENHDLTELFQKRLGQILEKLEDYPLYAVSVEVHRSSPGREEENLNITEIRAQRIFEFLKKSGISRSKLSFRGFGETELLNAEDIPFSHYRNERIVLVLTRLKR